jgi:hypothetical protein
MSTPESFGVSAEHPTGRVLFRRLFDDAAVFPPELATLPQAITDHLAVASSSCADLLGPLLLPADAVEDLLSREPPELRVVIVGRRGTDLALVRKGLSRLEQAPAVTVEGIEISWSPDWHQSASWGVSVSVEVPCDTKLWAALSDIQAHVDEANLVHAKFRTGSTSARRAPTSTELATFIRACVDHDLSFKLTGGLQHAISGTTPEGQNQLGFLNVIAATRWALAHGAEVPEMDLLLSQTHPVPILDIINRMSEADDSVVRAFFTSYGCRAVTEPIADLGALGLITQTPI